MTSTLPPDAVHQIADALQAAAVPIDDLHPHPLNARTRDRAAERELQTSLATNGQYRAVVARRLDDGQLQLLAGHGTTTAARALGWTHLAAEVHTGMDDATAARIVAVDNRTSDLAGYDPALEAALLEEIRRLTDGDLTGTGYTQDAYLDALDRAAAGDAAGAGLTDPDAVPDPPRATPISEPGQVWLLGPHRLAVGDGTDVDVVAAAVGQGRTADLLITDPPYGVDYVGKTSEALTIQNDGSGGGLRALLDDLFAASYAHVKAGGPAYVFHADTERVNFQQAFEGAGWLFKQNLQWVKDRFVLGRQDHHWQHEPILYGWKPGAAHQWFGGRTLTTLLDDETDPTTWTKTQLVDAVRALREESGTLRAKRPGASREHPTMKPVALLVRLLERSSRHQGLVLDTCAGSGAIMIAAHQAGRRAAMVELDPHYADVICRRWEEHTGATPVLEQTGVAQSFVPAEAAG